MLAEALETFKKEYTKYGDKLILDSYIPDDGEYIIVSCDEEPFKILDRVVLKFDKTTRNLDTTNQYYGFIRQADYYSKYLNSNKSISNKNIHSNNYLSFYTKIDGVQNPNEKRDSKKVDQTEIEKYYNYFRHSDERLKGKNNEKERLLFEGYEEEFGEIDKEKLEKIEKWVKENLFKNINFNDKQPSYIKSYIRFLFYDKIENYTKEGNRYFITKIYNSNTHNIEIEDKTFGLPDNNMGLNEKKPFLRNLTRKSMIPHYLSKDDVLMQKKLFEHLGNLFAVGNRYIYFNDNEFIPIKGDETLDADFNGMFLSVTNGMKGIEIQEFDIITGYKFSIKPIVFENILNIDNDKSQIVYGDINTIKTAKEIINEVLFSKYLTNNFFTEPKDMKIDDVVLKRNIIGSRSKLFSWFYKGISTNIWSTLNKPSIELILRSIFNDHFIKACERFNLRVALKDYFEGGVKMTDIISETKDSLRDKINSKETISIQDDSEYYFAVGQLIKYFISLSKSGNKKLSLANNILNSKSDKKIKEELRKMFIKYNHSIEISGKRFNNLYSMITSYEANDKINQDLMIAGYLHSSLIYESSTKDSKDSKEKGDKE